MFFRSLNFSSAAVLAIPILFVFIAACRAEATPTVAQRELVVVSDELTPASVPTDSPTSISTATTIPTPPKTRTPVPRVVPEPSDIPVSDRDVLIALYNATDGANWANNANWLSDKPIGEWHGVAADASGRATHLTLHDNRIAGEIPSDLGYLSSLEHLVLSSNQLVGELPPELGNLSNLTELDLDNNQLRGEIPSEFGQLSSLNWLSLEANHLSGAILTL